MCNTKPTLVILAAGMGSRYGGLKQMDSFTPEGDTIIDFSLYDALQAGFGKVVFIIRKSFEKELPLQLFFYRDSGLSLLAPSKLSNCCNILLLISTNDW